MAQKLKLKKKLYRSSSDRMLAGVCGGIAEYFGIDSSLLRIGVVFLACLTGFFPLIFGYIICAIVVPLD